MFGLNPPSAVFFKQITEPQKMKQQILLDKLARQIGYFVLLFGVIFLLINANKMEKLEYTPYQMLIWEIKANEGYRDWWYKDGHVKGKQAYSIGFGWNDQGGVRRKEIAKFTSDRKVTFQEATQITLKEIQKYGTLHPDPLRNLALQLYSYNCGLVKTGSKLGKCHDGKWGCGSPNADIRKAHNRRRMYELALWKHDLVNIQKYTEANKDRLTTYISKLKQRGTI